MAVNADYDDIEEPYDDNKEMLIQFCFRNFRSFREEAVLDMTAVDDIKTCELEVVESGLDRLLPVAAVLGANGSGKSNLVEAFKLMTDWVLHSHLRGKLHPKMYIYRPFLFDEVDSKEPTEFQVFVSGSMDGKPVAWNYGFSVDGIKVQEEWLNIRVEEEDEYSNVFFREGDEIQDGHKLGCLFPFSDMRSDMLILTMYQFWTIKILKPVWDWFNRNVIISPERMRAIIEGNELPADFDERMEEQKDMIEFLNCFDPSVKDLDVVKSRKNDGSLSWAIWCGHSMSGSDELLYIPFRVESAGTRKMFALYMHVMDVLEKGGVLMIDDLDRNLHPLTLRFIIYMFINPGINKRHAQLLFTAHDSWLFAGGQLRRDQILFTNKKDTQESELYSLSDFNECKADGIWKEANLLNDYMLGRYGAIPDLKPFFKIEEDEGIETL